MEDPMFKSRTDNELLRMWNGMLHAARECGVDVTGVENVREFSGREHLLRECQSLHTRLEKFKSGVDHGDETPGLRRLRSSPTAENIRQRVLSDQKAARRAATSKREINMTDADTATAPAPKKARAKKAAAKKAAPKKAAAKTAKRAVGAAKFDESAKITMLVSENPRREGTGAHERFKLLMRWGGKTVGGFLKAGGKRSTLNRAVAEKVAKVA
jgi:hypothetical protein